MKRILWLFFLTAAAVASPSVAMCDMQQFIPRIIDYSGEFDIYMLRQANDNKTTSARTSTVDTSAIEQFRLSSAGYIYHPALITFLASGSFGLLQDQFKNNGTAAPWSNTDANEYNLTLHVLPEKQYSLDLLTSRSEPFASTGAFTNIRPVTYVNSATFYYRGSPINFSTGYTDTRTVSDTTTDSRLLNFQAQHGVQHSFTSVGYSRSDSTSSAGTDYSRDYYLLSNQLQFERLLLRSELKYDDYNNKDLFQTTDGTDNSWTEYLHLKLPWRFESDLTYSRTYSDSKSVPIANSAASAPQKQSNTNDSLNEVLSHRLGESLFTSYAYNDTTNKSSGGQSDNNSNSVSVLYTKKIPWGTFTAGTGYTVMKTDNIGSVITLNEVHTSKADGIDSFTLQPGLIDPATIVVDLVAPGTGIIYPLVNNVNYLIDHIGNTFRITVQSFFLFPVPGFTPNPDINFAYTYNVTYRSTQGTFGLQTNTIAYNAGLALFANLLNPYYSHQQSDQTLVSGFFPGELSSFTVDTEGIVVQKAPFRLSTEYQKYDSASNPSRTWRSRFDFWENMMRSLSLSAGVFYNKSNFLQSQSGAGLTSPYSQTVRGVNVSVQKIFPWNLNLSGSGYFAQTTGRTESNNYSLNGVLTWRVGRLSVDLQTTYQLVDSVISGAKQTTASTMYLLRIRRQLF